MRLIHHYTLGEEPEQTVISLLHSQTALSKQVLKKCLSNGCVWLKRPGKKEKRVRRAKFILQSGDRIALYYDSTILSQSARSANCLLEHEKYSVWVKPENLLSQGTRFGDHCSLLRQVEKTFSVNTTIHLLHRLDREARGLVMLAHNRQAASNLSSLFQKGLVEKRYWAIVNGLLLKPGAQLTVDEPLDGKNARTELKVSAHNLSREMSLLEINLITGRYHQIRRHLSGLGTPIVGDRRYGIEIKSAESGANLQLEAYTLAFPCPYRRERVEVKLNKSSVLDWWQNIPTHS